MSVIDEVAAERCRQIEAEGWTPEHDDDHGWGVLASAAACYALTAARWHSPRWNHDLPPSEWPWDASWWKSTDPRRNLVKAAALIIAEIERLDRTA